MSKQQYTVFLSSTFDDLIIHRKKIIDSLIKLQQNIQAMEFWAPTEKDSLELSLKKLRKSKIYIGILGTRYGTVIGGGKSITQLEYEEACKLGLQRQVYLIDEEKHPVIPKNVDIGENAIKLKEFKKIVSQSSVRGTFISDDDLTKQVITNIIELLKEEGEDIRAAISRNIIPNFPLRTGYSTVAFIEQNIDISSILQMNKNGVLKFSDHYVESVAAAAVVAKNIKEGNFDVLQDFITLHPDVYKVTSFLIKDLVIDTKLFANTLVNCEDALVLRLLIVLAGQAQISDCITPICDKALATTKYHNDIKALHVSITPFYDVVKESLSEMDPMLALPIIQKYLDLAKKQKKWHAKRTFENAIKKLSEKQKMYNKSLERNI